MNELEKLIELAPCVVEFVSMPFFVDGAFHHPKGIAHHIEVDRMAQKDTQIAILAHEIGHALCEAKGCKCRNSLPGNHEPAEYHAMKFALTWLLKHQCKVSLRDEFCNIRGLAKNSIKFSAHHKAAKRITKLKLWQKCEDYIEEQNNAKTTHTISAENRV